MMQPGPWPPSRWMIVVAMGAFAYALLLGATGLGELHPWLRVANAATSGAVTVAYLLMAPGRADRVDKACLAALLVFLVSALLSQFMRQSMDAAFAALTYVATFFLARRLLADVAARRALVTTMWGLSAILTLVAAARWLPLTVEWLALTGWRAGPPLDMNLGGVLWGHRHDLSLVVALLYPSWWIGRPGTLRMAAATIFGVLAILVVVVDGSRTLWLAMVVASLSLALPRFARFVGGDRRRRITAGAAAVAIGIAIIGTGLAGAGLDRVLTTNTLVSRVDMWGPLTGAWLARPITGFGPGSFPWLLQDTGYFDTNTWAPRHPDSVIFQLLPELGVLGLIAILVVCAALAPHIVRGPAAARWALAAFVVAGLGSNPTEFAFLVVLAIGWAAYAVPNRRSPSTDRRTPASVAAVGLLAVSGVAYGATAFAAIAYGQAGSAIGRGDMESAATHLRTASAFDPALALYPRQLGAVRLAGGDAVGAVVELEHAVELNPNDDLAWRSLALAYNAADDMSAARAAIDHAISLQRSDPTNLLLRMAFETRSGHDAEAVATATEIVQAWPWIVGAEGWTVEPSAGSNRGIVERAASRWEAGATVPLSAAPNGIWLAALGSRDDLMTRAVEESGLPPTLARAYAAVLRCDPAADRYFRQAPAGDLRFDEYWALRVRDSSHRAEPDPEASRVLEIMRGRRLTADGAHATLNPLDENGEPGFSADVWGYRRPPITWPAGGIALASPDAAAGRWLVDPAGAAAAADLGDVLAPCT